jgi:hypothetical protein
MPRLHAIVSYQREYPPTHQLVAGFLGVKKKRKTKSGALGMSSEEEMIANAMAAFAGAGIAVTKKKRGEVRWPSQTIASK